MGLPIELGLYLVTSTFRLALSILIEPDIHPLPLAEDLLRHPMPRTEIEVPIEMEIGIEDPEVLRRDLSRTTVVEVEVGMGVIIRPLRDSLEAGLLVFHQALTRVIILDDRCPTLIRKSISYHLLLGQGGSRNFSRKS
jgi:hypothetical protein